MPLGPGDTKVRWLCVPQSTGLAALSALAASSKTPSTHRRVRFHQLPCPHVFPRSTSNPGEIEYQASSPDEEALLDAARHMGVVFVHRDRHRIEIRVNGRPEVYLALASCSWDPAMAILPASAGGGVAAAERPRAQDGGSHR